MKYSATYALGINGCYDADGEWVSDKRATLAFKTSKSNKILNIPGVVMTEGSLKKLRKGFHKQVDGVFDKAEEMFEAKK